MIFLAEFTANNMFYLLVIAGILMLGIEVVIPGGVVGALGFLILLAAAAVSFLAFGPGGGTLASCLLVIFSGCALVGWLFIFPKTRLGKTLTLQDDGSDFNSTRNQKELIGTEGLADTHLRPAGLAHINGKRMDVVAESGWIEPGAPLKVVEVEGNRIVVRDIS